MKGKKQCPSCQTVVGCRTIQCKCGHTFVKSQAIKTKVATLEVEENEQEVPPAEDKVKACSCKRRKVKSRPTNKVGIVELEHPVGQDAMMSPGLWVYDLPSGMPKIYAPSLLPAGPISNQDVYDQVTYYGLGDCIFDIIPPSKIADKKLSKLWDKARQSMIEVRKYLTGDKD